MIIESYIRSNTAHDIYLLNGQVPETVMSGETADISFICELGWYDWVKFRDTSEAFPNDKVVLGRYLGPSIDVGPALTAKILKMNGTIVYQSTYRGLNDDERNSAIEQAMRDFDDQIRSKVGPGTSTDSFKGLNIEGRQRTILTQTIMRTHLSHHLKRLNQRLKFLTSS